jgi:VWFA-related protein
VTTNSWRFGLAALIAAAPPRASAQAPPVFRASIEAVYVDVFVSRGGQPIPGLQASNFELKDNGVRQAPELVAAESRPLRPVLVFDTSSSLTGERLAALKAAGVAFLNGLRPADQAALVAFSDEITWLAPETADRAAVRHALDRLQAAGATSAFDALYAALALSEEEGRSLIVLFTDGEDNMSFLGEKQLMTALERSNALVHTVGWREPVPAPPWVSGLSSSPPPEPDHIRVLRRVAETAGGRFWAADSPERLRRAFGEIADAMGHRYILRYEPQGLKREGWHRIEIKLRGQKGDLQARHGYWVAPRTSRNTVQ